MDSVTLSIKLLPLQQMFECVRFRNQLYILHCKKRIVILTTVICYLVVGDNTLPALTQLIAKMV